MRQRRGEENVSERQREMGSYGSAAKGNEIDFSMLIVAR